MKSPKSNIWISVAYILGGILLLIGAARFIVRGDMAGVVIFTLSGVLAISLGITRMSLPRAKTG